MAGDGGRHGVESRSEAIDLGQMFSVGTGEPSERFDAGEDPVQGHRVIVVHIPRAAKFGDRTVTLSNGKRADPTQVLTDDQVGVERSPRVHDRGCRAHGPSAMAARIVASISAGVAPAPMIVSVTCGWSPPRPGCCTRTSTPTTRSPSPRKHSTSVAEGRSETIRSAMR